MGDPAVIITKPGDGTHQFSGVLFPVICAQQFHDFEQGAAALQFSNEPDGPWTTYRNDGSGPLSGPIIPWSTQGGEFTIEGVAQHDEVYVRAGIWPGQGGGEELLGPPTYVSPPLHWLPPITKHEHGAPEGHPTEHDTAAEKGPEEHAD